jgi:2-oxoglutarate dehydrogenase E1 component
MNTYSLDYIDDLYLQFIKDPGSVPAGWKQYFEQFSLADGAAAKLAADSAANGNGSAKIDDRTLWLARMQDRVDQLVREYRVRGHLIAKLDPLGLARPVQPEISPSSYGLSEKDLEQPFDSSELANVKGATLGEVLEKLSNTYCRSIGAQFMHIDNRNIRDWLQRRMESTENRIQLSHEVQKRIYTRLTDATIFEEFVRRQFVGAKTFSLEGAESLIPLLDLALEKCGQHGVQAVVLGMAHRGRLNVMANILKKRAQNIFWSFDDPQPELSRGGGDVRYHLGYSSDWTTAAGNTVHISLCFNPSHLEFVNPVALGRCRSKQDRMGDRRRSQVMTILVHGDASFAGEGVVAETLNLSELSGYLTGGTLHIVLNNQIGFTTEAAQGRSTTYATDIAKMLQIPIFHVNGEDPEAVAQVVRLAMDFRKEFRRDVVIDLYCYRRWGHNEGDEPRFTQPIVYQAIDQRPSVGEMYLARLTELGEMTPEEASEIRGVRQKKLEGEFESSKTEQFVPDTQTLGGCWQQYFGGPEPTNDNTITGIPIKRATSLLTKLNYVPEDFRLHPKLKRFFGLRQEMAEGSRPLDWATAEAIAFASLVTDGHCVRLSGQDVERGTFSQRHSVLHDVVDGHTYTPLALVDPKQAPIELVNSPLSEAGVLGFEYGYSLDCPEGLTIWEAQFGDFWNVAQVIVDQFIASAEDKWSRLSGLVMLLPHGFEGQGPEHCSARLERLLMLAAEDNMQICQPTTPAQYFHLLRRQIVRRWRKPLVTLTPKSLLRHPLVTSEMSELETGSFKKILLDPVTPIEAARRVLLCTGKIYYDLIEERQKRGLDGQVAVVRIEQLYPLRVPELMSALCDASGSAKLFWVQDEPTNMGAWQYIKLNYGDALAERFHRVERVSRAESASPSTGSLQTHKLEHRELMDEAFAGL